MQPETNATQKRVKILGDDEIEALYGRPHFTPAEQSQYFSLSAQENAALAQLHSIKSRLSFILQLGYFKARQQFFLFSLHEVEADARYIQEHYFPEFQLTDLAITKVTRLKQQRLILDLCHYRLCAPTDRQQLAAKARQAARVCSKPIYVLRELLAYLSEQRLVVPGYSFLQDTVSAALTYEQNRLITLVQTQLTHADREALKRLLADAQGLYEITLLKREPKDFSLGEIKREIERGEQIRPLYQLAQRLLPALDISNESIKYYASLVTYYSVFRLKQLDEQLVDLYLLCFLHHRYQRLHDHLITSLLHNVRRAAEAAKVAAKERVYAYRLEVNQDLHKAGRVLKLFTDDSIAQDAPFAEVQAKAFGILEPQKLDFIADHITTQASFDETAWQWDQIDSLAPQFKRHLRPILLAVEFAATQAQAPLLTAVAFLKAVFQQGKTLGQTPAHAFPLRFIPNQTKRYLYIPNPRGGKRLCPDRYEFLVYRLLRNGLEAGDSFCQDSVRFRSFEDDLIDDQQWQKKEELLAASGLALLKQPMAEQLAALEALLEERIQTVNQRIAAGENEHFQIKRRGRHSRWTLHYPQDSEPVNHSFFDKLRQVEIGDVLHFVNQQCHFLDAFEYILGRYGQQETRSTGTRRILTACLIAWATNMGLGKMGENSDLSDHLLAAASANFIRLETLRSANDLICNATAALPIARHYDLGATLHSSSDGQKFETGLPTINARHSPKYFGLKKGIVAYTLVANHIPVNARIIGADEHESHYVFDLLFNNTTDLQPQMHSTDTHGTNEVNFAILHLFGYQFAPRYQDIYDKVTNSLYGFKHPSQYADLVLKPIRKINTDLILAEEENIQRLMLSLALKTTTQSIIVSKLSAYPRKNKTKRALWEYDNIIRSLYLLDYVDSPPLRQNVQRALNRSENYHKLRRAVSYANFGKLRFKTEQEQQIWNECSCLITNCIIYYNAFLLSQLLAYKESQGDEVGAALLKQVSPVAWQHINLHGRYEFNKMPTEIDIKAIIHQLSQLPLTQVLEA